MASDKKPQLSQEEYARIKSLPQRKFIINGEQRTGLFDSESNQFYPTDENGELTGKCVTLVHKPKPKTQQSEQQQENPEGQENESSAPSTVKEEKEPKKKRVKLGFPKKNPNADSKKSGGESSNAMEKAKPIFIILAIIIVLFVIGTQVIPMFSSRGSNKDSQSPSQHENIVNPAGDSTHDGNLDNIDVIQATRDLIPGDVVTPDDIQSATISAEVFSQITLSGTQIYKWDRSEYLLDKYVTNYVPAGQYLAYDNVAPALTFAANPWAGTVDGTVLIKVPIDDAAIGTGLLNFGSILNLEIRKETVNQVATNGQNPTPDVDGLNHSTSVEQSVTVDTFTLNGLTACDILNGDGESIYNKYCAYNGIPAGEQLPYICNALKEDDSLEEALQPAYITVRVTVDQANALGDLTAAGTSTKLSLSESIDKDNDAKASFAANARSITATIAEAIEVNEAEAAEAQAAQEQAAQEALKQQQEAQEEKNGK